MHDSIKYLIPFVTFFGAVYLFLFESQKININQEQIRKLFHLNFMKKILMIIIICVLILIFFSTFLDLGNIINFLLTGETNTSNNHLNFTDLFFENYLFFTMYLLISLFTSFIIKDKSRIIYFMVLPLFILHYISNESMQIVRVMVYILPIYFFFVCMGLNSMAGSFCKEKVVIFSILFLFIISSASIFLQDKEIMFSQNQPHIPSEVGYGEYKPAFDYINLNLSNYVIITADYDNLAGFFFNTKIDYVIDFKKVLRNHYAHYQDEGEMLRECYTNISVIEKREDLEKIINNSNTCILLRPYSDDFLESSDIQKIKNEFNKGGSFIGFDIYCHNK
jgi:hypothetical protein